MSEIEKNNVATIWAVSTGSYSSYKVECVCPSKEIAEAVAAKWTALHGKYDAAEVEEFPFVSEVVDATTWYRHIIYRGWNRQEGTPDYAVDPTEKAHSEVGFPWEMEDGEWVSLMNNRTREPYSVTVKRRDPNEAAKIAREIWAKHEAERLGL